MPPKLSQSKEQHLIRLISRIARRLSSARGWSGRLSHVRLLTFSAAAVMTLLPGFTNHPVGAFLMGLVLLVFAAAVFQHSRLKRKIVRMASWKQIKQTHLARLRLNWPEIPPVQAVLLPEHHPYADDLDIVGPYSLLRLLDTTVSTRGHADLAAALLCPESVPENLEHRQALVRELVSRSLLRDKITLEAAAISGHAPLQTEQIEEALKTSCVFAHIKQVFVLEAVLLGLAGICFVLEHLLNGPRLWPYPFIAYVGVYLFHANRLAPIFHRALAMRSHLERLQHLFGYLETRNDQNAPELQTLCAPFHQPGSRPSQLLRKMSRICDGLSVKANPLVHFFLNVVFPWDFYFSLRYEHLRTGILTVFPPWMEALGRLEMAASLAQFAALHPEYAFPKIGRKQEARIVAEAIGHPLIPASKRVLNDFTLNGLGSTLLITGSNMSGKSTFLRTLGMNVCLAQAGGPVCARSFSVPLTRIFCSLRIRDDLEVGASYFYAEVKRLKQILDAMTDRVTPPVLFLIDEIFKGTNNRERILGSRAYLGALVQGHGFGLVTTHDLELTGLAETNPRISNAYFQEAVGHAPDAPGRVQLHFDYRLRSGVCSETNALRIMALEGLPVPNDGVYPANCI
jgi:hypothetical protein